MFFLDTYALIEIIRGNPNYETYKDKQFITTKLNLMELYYALLRLFDEKTADHYYTIFNPTCVPFSDESIKAAMKLRLQQREKKNLMSYVDAVGYIIALQQDIQILTGEKHFLGLRNVEFVQ